RWTDIIWNLELKDVECADITLNLVQSYNAGDRCLVTSFLHPVVVHCSRRGLVDCGLIIAHRPTSVMSLLAEFPPQGRMNAIVWDYETIDAESAAELLKRGCRSYVYNVISRAEHLEIRTLPIEAVITDHPDYLLGRTATGRRP